MKNLTFLALALFLSSNLFAQKGIKIGLQFTPGTTICLQSEDFDRGEDLDLSTTFGYNFGLTLGYGFSETFSISTGIMFNQHTSAFVHNREFLASIGGVSIADPFYKAKFSRTLGYVRVPVLLEIGSDPTAGGGFFFRIGPHFDFFTGGRYKDERLVGVNGYDADQGINLREESNTWEEKELLGIKYAAPTGSTAKMYNSIVIGMSLDIGGQIRLTDMLKLILTVHLESSLTNPEGTAAASFAHEWGDATYPNYISEDKSYVTQRAQAWNVMGGVTIGAVYTIAVD